MAKVRVHELAKELGVESKVVLAKLSEMGEFVKSASSTVEPPVVKRFNDTYGAELRSSGEPASSPKPAATPAPSAAPAAAGTAGTAAPAAATAPASSAPAARESRPAGPRPGPRQPSAPAAPAAEPAAAAPKAPEAPAAPQRRRPPRPRSSRLRPSSVRPPSSVPLPVRVREGQPLLAGPHPRRAVRPRVPEAVPAPVLRAPATTRSPPARAWVVVPRRPPAVRPRPPPAPGASGPRVRRQVATAAPRAVRVLPLQVAVPGCPVPTRR